MRKFWQHIALVFLLACVQPFEFKSQEYERLLVVDGLLTNELMQHEITLAYTRPVDQNVLIPATEARILVENDRGEQFTFSEVEFGLYRSVVAFAGEAGVTYTLRITTSENDEYISRPSTLLEAPPVDAITARYAELPSEVLERNEPGIQFFMDADPGADGSAFFRFDWSETAQIRVPYPSNWEVFGSCPDDCSWQLRTERVSICYETNESAGLTLGTTAFNADGKLSEIPLRFVSLETDLLRNKYSLEASVHAIDAEAFEYYSQLKEVNESGGSLFDNQQGAVIGNMVSVSDPDEPVLGYFEVSGVSRRREFFTSEDYGEEFSVPPFRFACRGGDVIIETTPDSIRYYLGLFPSYQIANVSNIPPEATLGPRSCTDCSWYAPTKKPDFWED
ncbi:MAG: DUF4249 domain-containing protein [Cytophagales bacterium]|nr:DUF4249 domain-containing protein [Cytophagales bacterium]